MSLNMTMIPGVLAMEPWEYVLIFIGAIILFAGAAFLFVFGKLPKFKLDSAYTARFSAEEFGVVVRCRERDVKEIDTLLREHGATEIILVES